MLSGVPANQYQFKLHWLLAFVTGQSMQDSLQAE